MTNRLEVCIPLDGPYKLKIIDKDGKLKIIW